MKRGILYIHGKNGSAAEAEHYRALFPTCDVVGLDYRAETPWEAQAEFVAFYDGFRAAHTGICVIANSIGAYFALHALGGRELERAYFISPIVDMERLIRNTMDWAGITEAQLRERGTVETDFGETISWEYLSWVRSHPITWRVPTAILYGERDDLQPLSALRAFAERTGAALTVMEGGEHWFHTPEQMAFLDRWILKTEGKNMNTIYLAGGCFWGVQKFFDQFDGVLRTEVGYANGPDAAPSYQDVCRSSGHAETVRVDYDPDKISLTRLLEYYFMVIDPLSVNRQGGDKGIQYRTGVYYTDAAQLPEIEAVFRAVEEKVGAKLAVELLPLKNFFSAEEYHQKYLDKNPGGYCHIPKSFFKLG